jgi:rare lipoprotein A
MRTMSRANSCFALLGLIAVVALALAGCGSPGPGREGVYKLGQPYQIAGRWYYPEFDLGYDRVGIASWYGEPFHGRATANGEVFDRGALTAAHPTLPLPSVVRVTNLANRRQLELRVNDRGPFIDNRLIDLSQAAARELGFERQGITPVRVEFIGLAEAKGMPPRPGPQRAPREAGPPTVPRLVLATAPASQCGGQFIQIGAFAEPEHASRAAAQLQGAWVAAVSTEQPASDRLTRVRLGPITDVAAAAATLDQLKRSGWAGAFLVGPDAGDVTRC